MRTDRPLRSLAAFAFFAACLASPAVTHAFCRTTTVAASPDFAPQQDSCWDQGLPLFHPSSCVTYHLLAKPSNVIPAEVLSDTLARAFATWTAPNATCTPGILAVELPPVDASPLVSHVVNQAAVNVIGVVDGPWPHPLHALSLTTLSFEVATGKILDTDMEISSEVAWSFGPNLPPDGYDLLAALTHETGHFLGLAHSGHPDAAMYASYTPGTTTERTLTDDDQKGICSIYPSRQVRKTAAGDTPTTACELTPGSATNSCGSPAIFHGCAAAPSSAGGASGIAGAFGIALVASAIHLRRRKGSPTRA